MAKELKLNLPTADSLFSTQSERDDQACEKVLEISLNKLDGFPDHPYPVEMDEEMQNTLASIKAYGVHTPAIVRPKENGHYELISGHRRKRASELAGYGSMPCIVRQMSQDDAIIMMVNCNLQREKVPPSAKAKAYRMKYEAIKRKQGERTDLTSATLLQKSDGKTTRELLAETSPDSHEQIRKYIRLTELIPQMQKLMDAGKIAMRPAVELSYLSPEQQESLLDAIESEESTPSHIQAAKMRKFSEEGRLNEDVILSIMQEKKPNQVEQFKMPKEKISRFFPPGTPAQKMEETVIKALELLRQRERSRTAR